MKVSNWLAIGGIAVLVAGIAWMVMGMADNFRETVKEPGPPPPMVARSIPVAPMPAKLRHPRPVKRGWAIDSSMAVPTARGEKRFPASVVQKMEVVTVGYLGFDGLDHQGQIVVDKSLAKEVKQIFVDLRRINYPIKKVAPVAQYGWDDKRSMADNNTSAFNYRKQVMPSGRSAQSLSKHSLGRAIDLNPRVNPYVGKDGKSAYPYNSSAKGALTRQSKAVKIFLSRGWKWGGDWAGAKDYQHFVKP